MNISINERTFVESYHKRRRRNAIFGVLAATVALTTIGALVIPATTEEYQPICGIPEHVHTDACWETENRLFCPLEEVPGHVHTEECYQTVTEYVCGYPEEGDPGHIHTDECWQMVGGEEWICGLEETEGHTHNESCYDGEGNLICELEESEGHIHTDACLGGNLVLVCGEEEREPHEHTDECLLIKQELICGLAEGEAHEHTEDCIVWENQLICGNYDPAHVHDESCYADVPVYVCEAAQAAEAGEAVPHVHNAYCFHELTLRTCGLEEHEHTDECYPALTGDPHADVELDIDWITTLNTVELTGNWAEDLVAIGETQLGYMESERNFVTDQYNVRRGYTRYGEWYGDRYLEWNALYVMFSMNYANLWGIPTDPSPARWYLDARDAGLIFEPGNIVLPGDLVFFDADGDSLADRVAIVAEVWEEDPDNPEEYPAELSILIGTQEEGVHRASVSPTAADILGFLALPENPDPVLPAEQTPAEQAVKTVENPATAPEPGEIFLTARTEDGEVIATLTAPADSFEYPADELELTIEELTDMPSYLAMDQADPYKAALAAIEDALVGSGQKTVDARLFDITVWRRVEVLPEPAADAAEAPADPEHEVLTAAVIETAGETTAEAAENNDDMLTVTEERADAQPVIEPAREPVYTLVEIEPVGPVQVTIEGLEEDEDGEAPKIYHVEEDGKAHELTPERFDGRSVTVTTYSFSVYGFVTNPERQGTAPVLIALCGVFATAALLCGIHRRYGKERGRE